ncbi:latent-transforming growth factor beta-binding protein 2 isoform X2 [Oryzias latipes]|uniref:latent-transforming growth factor beta-binding protein 2 isoform X2 n=1 Tax=Oryzias latipes TaxID=8090 RepID=UPI000CE27C8A|nr:latent-transforming growth factor beta-binding protein 2 isoform X2 [Oryzias latipes]
MGHAGFAVFVVVAVALLSLGGAHKETTGEREEGAQTGQQSPGISQGHPFSSTGHSPGSESPLLSPRAASPQDGHRSKTPREALDSAPRDDTQRAVRHPQSQQQRTRVNRRQSSKISSANRRLVGPNVCGGQQCCSGWAVAPGTNRCIKPDCQPPCQNRGSCSRPHTCVCRSGFQGPRCEDVVPEQVYIRERGTLRRIEPGNNPFQRDRPQRRPSERDGTDATKAQTPRPSASKLSVHSGSQTRRDPLDSSPQHSGTSRTVKRYPSSSGPITSNALPSTNGNAHSVDPSWYNHRNGHSNTPSGPSSGSHRQTNNRQLQGQFNNVLVPAGANLTSNLDRIKIVFTPMMCNRVCNAGRCYNNCEKGDITTVYSEASQQQQQQQPSKSQGFRLFFCQIPCLNGGRCIGRDLCWCPSNSTGKFCHLAAPPPARPTPHSRTLTARHGAKSPSQSMYTLPLSNQQVSLHPSLVNVHIQHPPEAEVQVHQVARVQPGQRLANTEGVHSVQQRSQPGNGHEHPSEHGSRQFPSRGHENGHARTHSRQNEIVGRCFQETVDGQCGKPLPGLTKQDDCCGSIGASWGLNKCQKCPTKPAYAVIANGQVQCPKGFKRMNATHCQDINECLLPGICKNADCVNTKGSYRCTCKPGYMLDAARSHCVSDKAVSEERASCYRSVSSGFCSLPLANHLTKQICCCSRVGKAWGHGCDRCPLPGSDHFKEICPAGHGYTYSRSDVQISVRQLEDDELQSTGVSLEEQYPQFPSSQPSLLFPSEPQHPSYPQTPQVPQYPDYHNMPQIPHHPLSPQHPSYSENEEAERTEGEEFLLPSAVVTDSPLKHPGINKCSSIPSICGRGKCISVQTGYTCLCDPGFKLSALQTNCIDVNECDEDPCEGKGHCINSYGSYTCQCHSGYSQVITQNRKFCQDINECSMPNKCQNGNCVNTEGSYTCECNSGFAKSWRDQCEDLDECKDPSSCPSGICINTLGSFQCQACSPGLRLINERCVDVNECLNQTVCGRGRCVNTQGSYRCNCFHGYKLSPDNVCQDVEECVLPEVCNHGLCVNLDGTHECTCNHGYQVTPDRKSCEDVNECATGNACPVGICINTAGSYTCQNCRPGFGPSADGLRCEDIDECARGDMCLGGVCANTEGSFICTRCTAGYRVSLDQQSCEDIDECQSISTCANGICLNSEGSYSCEHCPAGYRVSHDGEFCKDIDECALPTTCPKGTCTNTEGSYMCVVCQPGFRVSEDGQQCNDVNECLGSSVCPGQMCLNTQGSYTCRSCQTGFQPSEDGHTCQDINECQTPDVCPTGVCTNTEGSFSCMTCAPGFTVAPNGLSCEDVDECNNDNVCVRGQCINTYGSFLCLCEAGFKFSVDTADCDDQDECKEFGSSVCGAWRCQNTIGSYSCQSGILEEDWDKCDSEINCGEHGFCENTNSSFHCNCDKGYTNPAGDVTQCVDVNECETSSALCGEALCENYDGSFLCICPNDNEEFDPITNRCRSMAMIDPEHIYPVIPFTDERKECYYNLNDANYCNNVLSRNTTKQECCCTAGAGWGDNCEIHTCPLPGKDDYNQLCPHGSGILPLSDSLRQSHGDGLPYIDADECEMFGSEICKNGQCSNIFSTYTCFCRSGYYYDNIRFECVDFDECQFGNTCENGACVNTAGSFNCFCSPPLVLDDSQRHCISLNSTEETIEYGQDVHEDICWQRLEGDNMCADPHSERRTTFTECCCLHGVAWSGQCAFCPSKDSADYATMCNLPWEGGSDSLRDQIGVEYGPEGPPYWGNYGGPAGTYENSESVPLFNDHDYNVQQPPVRVPVVRPGSHPHPVNPYSVQHNAFEGLQAEECGILNGCENGRCVRVQEGYTCDCFDGYELDLSKMACVDINECEDISDKVPLCHNGQCTNTEGSYKCTCFAGFVASAKPHTCIPTIPDPKTRDSEN